MQWTVNSQRTPMARPGTAGGIDRPVVTTTLYHLIAGLQECITAENDDLLVAVVHHLIGTGRIKVLQDDCDRQMEADRLGSDA